jgi:hypothetical protein
MAMMRVDRTVSTRDGSLRDLVFLSNVCRVWWHTEWEWHYGFPILYRKQRWELGLWLIYDL